jgi:tetratricopeptide (TPR) repeat protein
LFLLARYDEAQPLFEETIRTAKARGDRRIELETIMELADLLTEDGKAERAAAKLAELTPFVDSPMFSELRHAHLSYSYGLLALHRGDSAEARTRFADSLVHFDRWPAKISRNAFALVGLARAELGLGHLEAAEAAARRAIAFSESLVENGAPSYLVGLSRSMLGEIQIAEGRTNAARESLDLAIGHLERTLGANHPDTRRTRRLAESIPRAL